MATSHDNLEKTQNFLGNLFSQFSKLGDELLGKRKSTRGKEVEPLHEGYLTSLDFEEQEEDRWILCSRIVCNSESLRSARQIIQKFVQESRSNDCPKRLLSISCHEDPDVPGVFMLIEVFQTQLAMVEYQKENLYQSFLRQLQPLMKEPLGVHLSKERNGKILSSLYPYGPGGRSILTVGASIMALRNPTRADLVATVGELTGVEALRRLRDRLLSSPKGKEILKQRPRIDETTNSICRDKLKLLEPHTFGYRYEEFLSHHQFSPLERPLVRFIEDEELAYIMQRYREVHDFWHVLLEIPPTVQGEVILKWFEGFHTGLPFCFLAGCSGPFLLSQKQQVSLVQHDIPWAFHTARNCVDLLAVEYEKLLDKDLSKVQKHLRLIAYSSR
ncbi:hypothetical protein Gasu2_16800 [Galdieria sulphuraria]|nr:hypothetical protein Gasu2_16800 [Galdieria sulphuraria]